MLKNKALKQRVEKYLIAVPHCRDDDNRLMCNIWREEMEEAYGLTHSSKGYLEFLMDFSKHKLSSPESIRRMRQKIQEQQPMLRGTTYQQRQRHQNKVKQEVRTFQ